MRMMYAPGENPASVKAVLTPEDLPRIWPLVPANSTSDDEKELFRRHIEACEKGDLVHINAELLRCRRRPDYYVLTHCRTKDEHDARTPVKRFPRRLYIAKMLKEAMGHKRLLISKSRQIMATWTFVCYFLHMAEFYKHRLIFFQSKKDEDAAALISRAKHAYEHQPEWIKARAPLKRPLHKLPYNKIMFANGSMIWGIPQGEDVVRQHTCSGILDDELAFQPKAEQAYTALKPTLDGGGQFVGLSSANGKNFFYRMLYDRLDESERPF